MALTLRTSVLAAIDERDVSQLYPELTVPFRDEEILTVERLANETLIYRRLLPLPNCGEPSRCESLALMSEDILGSTLPEGLGGPLRYDAFLARSFSIDIEIIGRNYVELSFFANPDAEASLGDIQATFEGQLERTLTTGVSEQTFVRILRRQVDSLESVSNRARYDYELALENLMHGKEIFGWQDEIDAFNTIELGDLNAFLSALDNPSRTVVRHLYPVN